MMKLILLLAMVGSISAVGMVGGWKSVDPIDDETHGFATEVLALYDDANTEGLAQRLVSIDSAKIQVVAGLNYQFKLKVGLLSCSEEQSKQNSDCKITKQGDCDFQVFHPLQGEHELTHSQCGDFVEVSQS